MQANLVQCRFILAVARAWCRTIVHLKTWIYTYVLMKSKAQSVYPIGFVTVGTELVNCNHFWITRCTILYHWCRAVSVLLCTWTTNCMYMYHWIHCFFKHACVCHLHNAADSYYVICWHFIWPTDPINLNGTNWIPRTAFDIHVDRMEARKVYAQVVIILIHVYRSLIAVVCYV